MCVTGLLLTRRLSKAITENELASFTTKMEREETRDCEMKLPADPESKRCNKDTGWLDKNNNLLIQNCSELGVEKRYLSCSSVFVLSREQFLIL